MTRTEHDDHVPTAPAVPNDILTTLLGGFASHIGEDLRERAARNGRQVPLHPGDHYGRVLAWAWATDRSMAMMLLLDVLVALRTAPPGTAPISPAYTGGPAQGPALRIAAPLQRLRPAGGRGPRRRPHDVRRPRHLNPGTPFGRSASQRSPLSSSSTIRVIPVLRVAKPCRVSSRKPSMSWRNSPISARRLS